MLKTSRMSCSRPGLTLRKTLNSLTGPTRAPFLGERTVWPSSLVGLMMIVSFLWLSHGHVALSFLWLSQACRSFLSISSVLTTLPRSAVRLGLRPNQLREVPELLGGRREIERRHVGEDLGRRHR